MAPIRFGLIGTGPLGRARAQTVMASAEAELLATAGPGPDPGLAPHADDPMSVLLRADLDALIYAGPVSEAARYVPACLGRRLHVLCATPPGAGMADVMELREAEAATPDRTLWFGTPLRYHGSVRAARAQLAATPFGRLLTARALVAKFRPPRPEGGGGILMARGLAVLDLMQSFTGPFEEVHALFGQGAWASGAADDDALALMRTHDGTLAQLHASASWARETFRLELGFEQGYLWLDGLTGEGGSLAPEVLVVGRPARSETGNLLANPEEDIHRFEEDTAMDAELADFLAAVTGRAPQLHGTSQQAFDAMNLVQRLYAADRAWPAAVQPSRAAE